MTDKEIAEQQGCKTTEIRAMRSFYKKQEKRRQILMAKTYRTSGCTNRTIAHIMGIHEAKVRALLK